MGEHVWSPESSWGNTADRKGCAIDVNARANGVVAAAEQALPEPEADDGRSRAGLVIFGRNQASAMRPDPEDLEVVARHDLTIQPLGVPRARDVQPGHVRTPSPR